MLAYFRVSVEKILQVHAQNEKMAEEISQP
jgi:hypothetical protein